MQMFTSYSVFGIQTKRTQFWIAGSRFSKADGGGILLDVTPGDAMSWVFRCRLNSKRGKMALGRYPDHGAVVSDRINRPFRWRDRRLLILERVGPVREAPQNPPLHSVSTCPLRFHRS
jgi:hypothetical protein